MNDNEPATDVAVQNNIFDILTIGCVEYLSSHPAMANVSSDDGVVIYTEVLVTALVSLLSACASEDPDTIRAIVMTRTDALLAKIAAQAPQTVH